jgi:hypothetical protein
MLTKYCLIFPNQGILSESTNLHSHSIICKIIPLYLQGFCISLPVTRGQAYIWSPAANNSM